jgi:RNA polymerase primary sigma factor
MEQTSQSRLKLLVAKGKEQGYLTYAEVNDHLPADMVDSDQIEDIIQMINDMGIQVFENAPDQDTLMMSENSTDEDAAEAAAQVLATVEGEIGRTTDPVRMYMREMGTVELLTREGEIVIAKRIEEGIKQVQTSVSDYPAAIASLLDQYDKYEAEEMRLSDIITNFIDPDEDDNFVPGASHIGSALTEEQQSDDSKDSDDDDEDEEEVDTGPDPVEAAEKFGSLRTAFDKVKELANNKGRDHADTIKATSALSEVFREFRLVPKQFDRMVKNMRDVMDRIRVQERLILKFAVNRAKMPKREFTKVFPGNESDKTWLMDALKSGEPYVQALEDNERDILRAINKLKDIEQETDLTIASIKDINRRMSIGEAKARRAKKEMVEAN